MAAEAGAADQLPSVLLTLPTRHWLRVEVLVAMTGIIRDPRCRVRVSFPTLVPFENALHHIVAEWIDKTREDFWINIDHDNPPTRNPLDLVALNKDVIGLPTPVWHWASPKPPGERPVYWNAYDWSEERGAYVEHPPMPGLHRVDAVGTGCFLMARRVFDDHPELRKAPFRRETDELGRVTYGNDLSFATRARAVGVEFWAHYDYPCHHFSEIDLFRVWDALGHGSN